MQPHLLAIIEQRTAGHLPIDDWGPTCAGCGADEFRLDGYCSLECRDFHSDEGIEELGDALVKMEIRAEAAEEDLRATEKLATDERERRIAEAEAELKDALEAIEKLR